MKPVALGAGLVALAAAWGAGLPAAAGGLFLAHMAMHLLVVTIAAPLLAIGLSDHAGRMMARAPALFAPLLAALIELAVVWGWHAPGLHGLARASAAALAVEQASFLAVGLIVWISALAPSERETTGAGVLALLATSVHMTLLGALIALAPRPLYRTHQFGGLETRLGLDPLTDQQLGGALMLTVGGTAYLVGGLVALARVLRLSPEADIVPGPERQHEALSRGEQR